MTDKITMSIENSQNKIRIKEINTSKASKNDGSIREFKMRAILKFCKENHTESGQHEEIFNLNILNKIGKY